MGKTKPRIVIPAVQRGAKASASRKTALTAKSSLTAKPSLAAKHAPTKVSSLAAKPLLAAKPTPTAKPLPIVVPRKKPVNASPKVSPQPNVTTGKKLTLSGLLGTELENAKSWCRGFAHGTHYDAFLGMVNSDNPAILPYVELPPNLQKAGRRNEWKKKGVFFRIVKNMTWIINSVGSTGASGGVILFMPIDKSLDFKLYSLSGTDTQMSESPATPSKGVFDSLSISKNLTIAEIAFGERIPLSCITKVFLLVKEKSKTEEGAAASWLLENGFCERKSVRNFRGMYRQFVR